MKQCGQDDTSIAHGQKRGKPSEIQMKHPKSSPNLQITEEEEQDELFDMFADDFDEVKLKKVKLLKNRVDSGCWDDNEGYYQPVIGEMLHENYKIESILGKGVFSNVVKAYDQINDRDVAIKIMRSNDVMTKAGKKEASLLTRLMEADPEQKRYIIRKFDEFMFRNHFCIVFELQSLNLRDLLKKYGRNTGLNIKAIRVYAHQLFLALYHMERCGIVHADIKPDNILVCEESKMIKLGDLGSGTDIAEKEIAPYLVSRFYRAPEIILGIPYDYKIDMWSVGCTLYEIFTGKVLFPGQSNNQMLELFMELRGKIPHKVLKRGTLTLEHFDAKENYSFLKDVDGQTQRINFGFTGKDFKEILKEFEQDEEQTALLADLLAKCLNLNPLKRLSALQALSHPFITQKSVQTEK